MKRKLLIMSLGVIIFALLLAFSSFASINYSEKAVLADGTILPIYDENQNPLIWYVSGVDANGKNIYSSVPNNRNAQNTNNDDYVTYTNSNGNQLTNINFNLYDESTGKYVAYTEDSLQVVVFNMRGLTGFIYLHSGFKCSDIQYIYFHEELKDCCKYFQNSTNLRLVDLTVCTKMTGGFGETRNFYNCTNLHTIRFAPVVSYALTCSQNNNWRFANTSIVELVIPANITSLGVDNFKDNSKLESIYILGNTTSLGQRNFLNCTSLTNVYILGDNPSIDLTSFKENFYECVDGNKLLDFKSTGKYFFFATTNEEYLNGVKDAIGAAAIITYSEYKANTELYANGRYIISGTNACETLNKGVHTFDEGANACAGVCTECGEIAQKQEQAHIFSATISYANYLDKGVKYEICSNANCQYSKTPYISDTAPLISEFKGISTKINGDGITFGYSVNYDALNEYVMSNGNTVELGFVVAVKSFLGDKSPLDASGNESASNVIKATLLKWTTDEEANNKIPRYISADFRIVGDWNITVDLDGDSIPETDVKDVEFYMAGYIIDGSIVKYINYQKTSDTADYVSYNGIGE